MSIKDLQKWLTSIVCICALTLSSCRESGEFVYNDLSENKILFTTRTVEGWTGQQAKSRAVLSSNEKKPLIVKSDIPTPLYLHPVTQIGTHIQTANNIPITKSGRVIMDESTGKVIPTRGTPNTSSSIGSSFGLLAYRSASSATDLSGIAPDFINNQQVSTSGSIWKTGTDYFWPDNGDKLSFFAYTPFGNNNVTIASASSTGTPSITYTASTDVTKQPDLMVAKTLNQTRNTTSIAAGVDMSFSHTLTAITFAVGKDMVPGVFKSISIKGAITTATYNLSTSAWDTSNGTSTGDISITLNGTTGIVINGTADVALTSGTSTMMMIPQTFSSGSTAYIEAVFNNGNGDKTLKAPLAGTTWDSGTSIIYKLSTSSVNTMTLGTISYPSSWGGTVAPVSSFQNSEAVGIYVVDQNNNIKNSNVRAAYNGSSWILDNNILFSPQYKYFAYYPYKSSYSPSSVTAAATTADAFFADIISGWSITANQNTTNDFKGNDLQVAMGTVSSTASSITFDMAHKMGLAVINLGTKSVPTTRTYTGGNSTYSDSSDKTTVTASSNFSGNQPVSYNNKYYYITKAGTSTTFNSITADNDAWSAPLSITISSGSYSTLTATNTSRSFYKFIVNFNYTGSAQSFTIPLYGTSKFECWGASGGSATYNTTVLGGKGGYSYGNITLTKDKVLYISIGGAGANGTTMNTTLGGWNGGASRIGTNPDHIVGGGGGCTSIQSTLIEDGQLKKYESVKNTDVLIVAGGGGGGFWHTATNFSGIGGTGGGTNGGNGTSGFTGTPQPWGSGGTQTSGGTNSYNEPGYFGMGGGDQNLHAGGGGGWYGGGAGYGGAGGGSGYIGGITNGGTSNGVRNGNGFACITFVP